MEKYYIMVNGAQQGPFSKEEIINQGFEGDSYVFSKSMGSWKLLSEVPFFQDATAKNQNSHSSTESQKFTSVSTESSDFSNHSNIVYGGSKNISPSSEGSIPSNTIMYATWGERFGARLLDTFFMISLTLIFAFLIVLLVGVDTYGGNRISEGFLYLFVFVILVLYNPVLESGKKQGTWGKQIVGIKIVNASNNSTISFWQSLGRQVSITLIAIIPLGVVLDHLAPLWDAKKQTWHDKIAGSIVVYK